MPGNATLITIKWIYVIRMHKNSFIIKCGTSSINVSSTGSHNKFRVHYGLWLEMAGSVFLIVLDLLLLLYYILVHFVMHTQIKDSIQGLLKSNLIYCLLLEKIIESRFLMISKKVEKYLWLQFVCVKPSIHLRRNILLDSCMQALQ